MKRLFYIPLIDHEKCEGCDECALNCPLVLFDFTESKPRPSRTLQCLNGQICIEFCQKDAIHIEEVYLDELSLFDESLAFAA